MKLLIPFQYLNEACYLSDNIDEKKFKMVLKIAQEDLSDILGPEFYAQIETQYDPSSDTFSTANATLYEDYLKDYLAWSTYYRFLGFSQSDSTPTGEREHLDENSVILDDVKLLGKSENVRNMMQRYKNKIINYLKLQQDISSLNFPLWKGCQGDNFSWGISGIERDSYKDKIISITKATTANE